MKKIAVLGATGKTGQQVLKIALDQGNEVVALCRNPSGLPQSHGNLQAVQADVFSVDSMKPHFAGCDAVVSCLGGSFTTGKMTFYSPTISAIVTAMKEDEIRRLVCMTSWATDYRQSNPGSFFIEWMLKPFMRLTIGSYLNDMREMEGIIQENSQDLNYTIIRPPGLSNGPLTGKAVKCEVDGQYVYSASSSQIFMSRADVANFMLSTLDTSDYDQKIVAICL